MAGKGGLRRTSFRPGQSGNPRGRPKIAAEIRALARQYTDVAIETLTSICMHGKSESARVAAAQALLDRGWGKVGQDLSVTSTLSLEALVLESFKSETGR